MNSNLLSFVSRLVGVYLHPYWRQLLMLCLTVLVAVGFEAAINFSFTPLFDIAIPKHDQRLLVLILAGLLVLFLIASAGDILRDRLAALLGVHLMDDLRLRMFTHLHDLPASYYDHAASGEIITRFSNDLGALETAVNYSLPYGLISVLRVLINSALLLLLDWRMALVTALVMPLTFIFPRRFARRSSHEYLHRRSDEAEIFDTVEECVRTQAVVRAYNLGPFAIADFAHRLASYKPHAFSAVYSQTLVSRFTDIGQWFAYLAAIAIGAILVFRGDLAIGVFISFITILLTLGSALSGLSSAASEMIPGVTGLERIEAFLDTPTSADQQTGLVSLPRLSREVRFEGVDFSYPGSDSPPAIRGVDLTIPAGQLLVLVGRSGCGKSTLIKLLLRFYDPSAGKILIDGYDLRQVSPVSLHDQTGVAFQENVLYRLNARENIRLGRLSATDAEVETAAFQVGLHEDLLGLPQGYDTPIGEAARQLPKGLLQRIALGRAILRDPALLLLDEITASLDPMTEIAFINQINSLSRDRTVILTTHRLALAACAEQIAVLDHGQIVEKGTHDQLLCSKGLYALMWQQQSGFYIHPGGRYAEVNPAYLRSIPLFSTLDDSVLESLASDFHPEYYDSGETIFEEGDPGDKFFLIARGRVAVITNDSQGQVLQIATRQDGEYVGEMALLGDAPRSATIRCRLPTLFLTLHRVQFLNLVNQVPDLRRSLEKVIQQRKDEFTQTKSNG